MMDPILVLKWPLSVDYNFRVFCQIRKAEVSLSEASDHELSTVWIAAYS